MNFMATILVSSWWIDRRWCQIVLRHKDSNTGIRAPEADCTQQCMTLTFIYYYTGTRKGLGAAQADEEWQASVAGPPRQDWGHGQSHCWKR
jgi:hypothetical protein